MTSFEYISTLLSIIVGLGITHLLIGIGRIINNPKGVKPYWIHLVWTLTIFIWLISYWWFEYRLISIHEWTFQLYLFFILYAISLFFLCIINMPFYFPDDFREYYYSTRKWFFIVLLFVSIIDITDTIVKGGNHFANMGIEYLIFITSCCILAIVGFFSKKELHHAIIAIFFCLYNLWYTVTELNKLSTDL